MASNETTEFTMRVKMQTRWVPYFLGMLQRMQRLGSIGSSREITFFSDGDGDFRPRFEWDLDVQTQPGHEKPNGDAYYDAG